ncbi:MAG: hypothetical protein A2Y38_12875 [Spirochaetes bacterium GWB1_59_5]|nr:MAG: hypothetical protein A2Y38_12875 [Spirochaetes bacterium GWB1_59_5]
MRKYPRILFFVAASMPTQDDFEAAEQLGPNVAFRNAAMISNEGSLEKCEGVAGLVPQRYADAYPTAEDAIADFETERKARLLKPQGDEAAQPKATPAPTPAKPATAPATPKPAAKPAVAWQPNGPTGQ